MSINAYTGLMGSGKSYEVVSEVILPAILNGRRVVTNVDGIDGDAIRAYLHEKRDGKLEKMGSIVHVTNETVRQANFFPADGNANSVVQPGDMVCIDEAWAFWGTEVRSVCSEHLTFFRMHRHYVDPGTKISCDLVLMVQDISDLNRKLKVVVELTFRTEKKKSLGLNNTYSVSMYQGYKITAKSKIGNWVRKYDKEIFPLYSSYSGGAGQEVPVDARHNVLRNPRLWGLVVVILVVGFLSVRRIWTFFHHPSTSESKVVSTTKELNSPQGDQLPAKTAVAPSVFSETWRIAGSYTSDGVKFVVLSNGNGMIRVESPSVFTGNGYAQMGEIDGARTTVWTSPGKIQSAAPALPLPIFLKDSSTGRSQ